MLYSIAATITVALHTDMSLVVIISSILVFYVGLKDYALIDVEVSLKSNSKAT